VTNNPKDKIFINKFIQNYLENESKVSLKNEQKFAEIASSLAYYLKSFSNINKLLDYICLIFKHIFNENIILIIPLNYEGEIWFENIKISASNECLIIQKEINSFLSQFHFSKNFKIKEFLTFENALKNNFKEYKIETKKIVSRGKCRGFIYIFSKDISKQSINEDSNFNFIENCLAVGLENHYLIKTKKKHENVDREIATGAEIQSQLLPDYCPIIHGIDLAAHCRPALQLGGDYYDFMCLKTNISEKRKESYKTSKNVFKSFEYAFSGIYYVLTTSRNFKIQLIFALISLMLGFLLQISKSNYMFLIATIMSVLILEILNTSIESIVDLIVKKEFSSLAKIAKDTSAGAVLLAALNSVIVAVYLFVPKIKLLF